MKQKNWADKLYNVLQAKDESLHKVSVCKSIRSHTLKKNHKTDIPNHLLQKKSINLQVYTISLDILYCRISHIYKSVKCFSILFRCRSSCVTQWTHWPLNRTLFWCNWQGCEKHTSFKENLWLLFSLFKETQKKSITLNA